MMPASFCPGTNIDPLLEKLFWGCFINAGQTCAA